VAALEVLRRRRQRRNETSAAIITPTGTATPTPIATTWLLLDPGVFEGVVVGVVVGLFVGVVVGAIVVVARVVEGFGNATPVDCGILAAPVGTSTILLAVEFKLDCAIPIRLFVRS
jgi:hypothetical protein